MLRSMRKCSMIQSTTPFHFLFNQDRISQSRSMKSIWMKKIVTQCTSWMIQLRFLPPYYQHLRPHLHEQKVSHRLEQLITQLNHSCLFQVQLRSLNNPRFLNQRHLNQEGELQTFQYSRTFEALLEGRSSCQKRDRMLSIPSLHDRLKNELEDRLMPYNSNVPEWDNIFTTSLHQHVISKFAEGTCLRHLNSGVN